VDSKLSFTDHITVKVNKAYSILGIIKRNFQDVDKDSFVLFMVALWNRADHIYFHAVICSFFFFFLFLA